MGKEGRGRKKAVAVLTTRGNYAKFKKILQLNPGIQTIVGGELLLSERVTPLFDIPISKRVYFNVSGGNHVAMAKSIGAAVSEFANALSELNPEILLLVGDRFETFGAAIAAYTLNIPIAHLEGGEISGTLDNGYRYAISELASYHFTATHGAAKNLSGKRNVFCVGATSLDVLKDCVHPVQIRDLQRTSGSGPELSSKDFLLVIYHPDTAGDDDIRNVSSIINALEALQRPTFWLNANMDAGSDRIGKEMRVFRDTKKPDYIHFFKSIPIEYYSWFLKNASCIIGNSSSGVREAGFLGTPNVLMGGRQINRETAPNTVISNGDLVESIEFQGNHGKYEASDLYGTGAASEEILCILGLSPQERAAHA